MGEASEGVVFPSLDDIVALNRVHIGKSGGDYTGRDNLHNRNSLEWVLDVIQYPPFGIYPTISEKAAILAFTIIKKHVFFDGCKRTGMSVLEIFLDQNGFFFDATDDNIFTVARRLASTNDKVYSFEQFEEWVRRHMNLQIPL
ncbi:hypothetical protein MNBD_CHLOROFLEXI01-4439 [hydrothermal vent metagenome]|uniref:Fido domain-containing protein n=1 Tax=hydrothermal vent metagenome TaxID=652676 RepID=A0A3B0VTK1_9ZZZZ